MRLATVEPKERLCGDVALGVSGTEQKALPKLDIHEVSQLNICSEVYDGTDYAVMRAFLNSKDIGVHSSKRFSELLVKQ